MAKWIKETGAGQLRGEGVWVIVIEARPREVEYYEYCKRTGYLPTAEQDEKPQT